MEKERINGNKAFVAIWSSVLAVVLIVAVVANVLVFTTFYGILTTFFSGGEKIVSGQGEIYFPKTASDHEAAMADSRELIKELQAEGTVLLKNDGYLPLKGDEKLTLFGRDSVDFMYGGGGSGALGDSFQRANLKEALEADGFSVNPVMWDFINNTMGKYPRGSSGVGMLLSVGEIPLSEYTDEVRNSYEQYADCAVVVIGRSGSEGVDLDTGIDGTEHALELGQDERDILNEACNNFENVIVIVNSSATLELGFLNDYPNIRAALYVGFTGDTGLEAIGDILNGSVNPSGHTVDTFAYDLSTAPSYVNMTASGFGYSNLEDYWFVEYEEGIYVGYRWYETADAEGFWEGDYAKDRWGVESYDDVVQFPFGFGLSYTTFEWEVAQTDWSVGGKGGEISVTVDVTNTGDVAGKDVVQLYFTAPYDSAEGIEKSSVVLAGFAKTDLIPAGGTDSVTITFNFDDLASFDYKTEDAYVLSAGEYTLSLRTDAHTVKAGANMVHSFNVDNKIVYTGDNKRDSDLQPAVNLFDDVSAYIKTYLSRADFENTMPTAPTDSDKVASQEVIDGVEIFVYDTYKDAPMPEIGAENGVQLVDLVGKDYDDPLWEKLLDNLTTPDLVDLTSIGGYSTVMLESIGKPPTIDSDGPGGFFTFFSESVVGAGYCSEVVVASTWNVELAEEMGRSVGEEGLQGGYAGWYAPAMNNHRSPFSGRNFEYYSEDGLLAGKMGAAVVRGCMEKGVYTCVKHYAVNDQETHRNGTGLITWVNEQAMREIYLKPFEITVKEGGTTAIMSSYNRIGTVWAGGNYNLLTEILRNEWGFKGMVITDYSEQRFTYMKPDQALSAGGDLTMETVGKRPTDRSSNAGKAAMRQAAKNILYTIANSHAMNGVEKNISITTETPSWVKWAVAIDAVVAIGIVWGVFLIVKRARKNKHD